MKLILFGGAEIGEVATELKQIEKVIKHLKPKQILHIPFARIIATEVEWEGDWFHKHIHLDGVTYLNAKNKTDITKAKSPLIFISGGRSNVNLLKKIKSNPKLLNLVKNSLCIIGESAGAKILGAYFRTKGGDDKSKMMKGLNLIKNTVIEPHYSERKRQKLLIKNMKQTDVKYGIGIDTYTAIEFEVNEFPNKYKKTGVGIIDIKKI